MLALSILKKDTVPTIATSFSKTQKALKMKSFCHKNFHKILVWQINLLGGVTCTETEAIATIFFLLVITPCTYYIWTKFMAENAEKIDPNNFLKSAAPVFKLWFPKYVAGLKVAFSASVKPVVDIITRTRGFIWLKKHKKVFIICVEVILQLIVCCYILLLCLAW